MILVNATTVAPHQELVQYLIYWQIMTSSSDPAMRAEAAWVQRGPGITLWEVGEGVKRDAWDVCGRRAHSFWVQVRLPGHPAWQDTVGV